MNRSKKTPRKPSGSIGPISVQPNKRPEFRKIEFPAEKPALERFVVEMVIGGLMKTGENFYSIVGDPIQNQEANFDFTLPTKNGAEYLELMEVAVLEDAGGSYDAAPNSYNHGQMADNVYSKIIAKAQTYGMHQTPIHLLLYTTDWRFQLASGVLALLGYWLKNREHIFKTILYFSPDDATHGEAKLLYPVDPRTWGNFDEVSTRNRRSIFGDLTRVTVKPDGSFEIPLGPPGG